jgi:streptogramin lyase
VANWADDSVTKLSSEGVRLGTYKVPPQPRKVAVDSQGNAWVYCWGPNHLVKLSPDGQRLVDTAIGDVASDMAIDAMDHVWLASTGSNKLYQLNPDGRVATWREVFRPAVLAIDKRFDKVWVSALMDGGTSNLAAFGIDSIEGYVLPATPQGLAVGPDGLVYISYMQQPRRMSRLAANRRHLDDLWTGFPGVRMVHRGDHLWVTNSTYRAIAPGRFELESPLANTVSKISTGGRVLGTYSVGSDAWTLAVAPSGDVWVVNMLSNRVTRLHR